jgi:rod shape-determining protein MreC
MSPSRTWRRVRLLLVLLAVSAFLFLLPARFTAPARVLFNEAAGPAQTALYQGAGETLAATGTLSDMFRGEDRERLLLRELEEARNRNAALADLLRRQKRRLESIRRLQLEELGFRALRAPVAAYDTSPSRRSISVRAGTRDGVRPGLAASAMGALVGVVQEAGPWQCRVRLITDPRSAVPCRLSRSRSVCILQGTGGPTCEVQWVDRSEFVEPGDAVVTASLDVEPRGEMRLPDGLPAANITDVARDRMEPLFYDVTAEPRVNLERLEEVEILIPEGGR